MVAVKSDIQYSHAYISTNLKFTEKLYPFAGKGTFVRISTGATTDKVYPVCTVTVVCKFKFEPSNSTVSMERVKDYLTIGKVKSDKRELFKNTITNLTQ